MPSRFSTFLLHFKLALVLAVFAHQVAFAQSSGQALTSHVNPFLGTDFFGHTFPGPTLPYGMVHVSPDVGTDGWTYCAGYIYQSTSIIGFSHTHWSGVGMVNGGEVMLMPTVGNMLQVLPGTEENPDSGYRSRYSHQEEEASPGYYSVMLKDYDVKVELTTTRRVGMHRYTFPKADNSRVILDLGHQIGSAYGEENSELSIVNNNRIEGVKATGQGKVYFVAEFSKPFLYYGTFDANYVTPESGASIFPYKSGEAGKKIGAFVQFETEQKEQILVKVGISYVDVAGARKNLEAEIPDWDFEKVRKAASQVWEKELSAIQIDGASENQKQIFYSALYRSFLSQYVSQDVDGRYRGSDGKIHVAKGFDFYGSFSCWDTYRSQHPLLTLTAPEHVNDFIRSIEAKVDNFGWLPAQHFQGVFKESMVGDHLIPVIVDAYMKGYRDYDIKKLYDAMRTKALQNPQPPVPEYMGRAGLGYYLELGYTPVDRVTEAVPNTLELAYDDWCIAQLAQALGKQDDYKLFMKRAGNYAKLWDKETQFMRPRKADGTWLEPLGNHEQEIETYEDHHYYKYFDPLLVGRRPNRHYTESNAWQYVWSVQHDPQGLIDLFGGNKAFTKKLDTFFEMSPLITPPKYVGVVGTIGQYVHGNQPSHHVAYLYNYAGQPWKTQEWVRQICEELYRPGPGGLCGNEDMGSLSSWYVLSSLGIYAVTPGSTHYVIGSPLFGEATLQLAGNKTFAIKALNNSKENKYIQSATLNGAAFNRTWITQDEITAGGELIFQMGPTPNEKWGTGRGAAPPSMSVGN
jgi:predicted alpha-1,2-mannosidase